MIELFGESDVPSGESRGSETAASTAMATLTKVMIAVVHASRSRHLACHLALMANKERDSVISENFQNLPEVRLVHDSENSLVRVRDANRLVF